MTKLHAVLIAAISFGVISSIGCSGIKGSRTGTPQSDVTSFDMKIKIDPGTYAIDNLKLQIASVSVLSETGETVHAIEMTKNLVIDPNVAREYDLGTIDLPINSEIGTVRLGIKGNETERVSAHLLRDNGAVDLVTSSSLWVPFSDELTVEEDRARGTLIMNATPRMISGETATETEHLETLLTQESAFDFGNGDTHQGGKLIGG